MAEVDYIKTINDRLDNIEKTFSEGNVDTFSIIIKDSINQQLEKFKKAKRIANEKVKATKDALKKLFKNHRQHIQNILSSSLTKISDNKCVKMMLNGVKSLFTGSKKALISFKNKITSLLKGVLDIMSSVKTYIFDKISSTFSIFNKLFFGIPGKVWDSVKFIFKATYKVFSWAMHLGKIALDFIWSGVKTIFNIGFSAISTTISYLAKGTKAFFTWWFKMLINTMFNPAMLIINAPLFIAITAVTFAAAGLVLITSASVILPIFEATFDIAKTVGGWIYDSISWVFNWIKTKYEGSYLQLKIVNPFIQTIYDNIPKAIKDIYNNVIDWSVSAYQWIKSNGENYFNAAFDFFSSIKKQYDEADGKSIFRKFLSKLVNARFLGASLLPNNLRDAIVKKFGFLISLEKYHGVEAKTPIIEQLKAQTQINEQKLVQHTIELQYAKLKQQNVDETEIIKILKDSVIPNLSNTLITTISSEEIQKNFEIGIKNAQLAIDKKINFIDEDFVKKEINNLSNLMFMKKMIMSGNLNALNPDVVNDLRNRIKDKNFSIKDEQTFRTKSTVNEDLDSLKTIMEKTKNSLNISSALNTLGSVEKEINDSKGVLASVGGFANTILDLGQYAVGEMENSRQQYYKLINSAPKITDEYNITPQPKLSIDKFEKKARGDIVVPNKKELSKTIALDTRGIDFIRSKVKEIISPMVQNKKENDDLPNITILEEQQNYVESYEVYTMSQLSKGILRN